MYIAALKETRGTRYELRRTVSRGSGLDYEVLADLGGDPARLVAFTRFGIVYAEELLEALACHDLDMDELDEVFGFLAPRGFEPRAARPRPWTRTTMTLTQEQLILELPAFDRRRMAYLRSGEVNLSRIDEVNPKLFRILVGKCRDEVEQMFLRMERELPVHEARTYVYAVFNLQRHFASLSARIMPESLEERLVDEAFLCEYCALEKNSEIWGGHEGAARVYLRRYAIMHYDHAFGPDPTFARIFQNFMNDFRRHKPRAKPVTPERVHALFGLSMGQIRALSRREFARIFRRKAMSMHPDKGGDHDAFVELLETYKQIVSSKGE